MAAEPFAVVDAVLAHLCHKGLHGDVAEWCEMRHDCVYVVTCPECGASFTLLEEEYDVLIERSRQVGWTCGLRPISA
ncbi:MAG: hypothetical protein QJR03_14155 [Sphaerobacter sp.]|nr:hypothetical protein [Sphaerobacter sp.]